MYCSKCGAQIDDAALYSSKCGCPTESNNQVVTSKQSLNGKSGFVLAAGILGTIYLIFALLMFSGNGLFLNEIFGTAAVTHIVLLSIAVASSFTAYINRSKTAALLSGITFSASVIFMLITGVFLVLPIIFSWIGFAKTPKEYVEETADM